MSGVRSGTQLMLYLILSEPLPIDSVMDILMLVAMTVYEVNPLQLTLLQLAKLLGQDSIETLVYK